MLTVLRHKGVAKKVLWFTIIIIVLSFGFFGVANNVDTSVNTAGKMNGRNVSIRDFQKAYLDTRDQAIMLYNEQFFKVESRLNLESQTWDRLILLNEAKKQKITTTDQEVIDQIATLGFVGPDGKFDKSRYEMVIRNPRGFNRTTHDFEEGIRGQINIKKLLEKTAGPATLNEEQLKKEYRLKNEKIKLTYALFEPLKAAQGISVTDEELKKYYDANKEMFRRPTMMNVEYISSNYPAKATDAQKEAVKTQIQAMTKDIKSDSDFKTVAQANKLEVKESGLFTQGQPLLTFAWSPELVEKIFSMKQGEYSQPVESPDGILLFRIKERQESSIPGFEQSKESVKTALLTDKGFTLAKAKADASAKVIAEGIKSNKNFKEIAASQDAKVEETPLFGRGEYIANMGIIAEFQEVASMLTMENRLSDVITTSQGPAIIYLDSIEAMDEKQYETDKASFKDQILAQKRNQAIVEYLTKLRQKANVKSELENRRKK